MAKQGKVYLPIPTAGVAVIIDTETTGLYEPDPVTKRMPSADVEGGPRMASVAYIVYDLGLRRVIEERHLFVLPDGWSMPLNVAAINGLDDEKLNQIGQPIADVLPHHHEMLDLDPLWIGYNLQPFDLKILRGEMRRAGQDDRYSAVTRTLDVMWVCSKFITGNGKQRRLDILHAEVFGNRHDRAHDALEDARATLRLFERAIDTGMTLGVSIPKNDQRQEAA